MIIEIIILFVLDALWITLQKKRYDNLIKAVQKTKLSVNMIGAVVAYILMVIGLLTFVIPNVNKSENKVIASLKYGGLYGLTVYGIFNATNVAIFKNYNPMTAIIDTLWGTTLFILVPLISSYINQFLRNHRRHL